MIKSSQSATLNVADRFAKFSYVFLITEAEQSKAIDISFNALDAIQCFSRKT